MMDVTRNYEEHGREVRTPHTRFKTYLAFETGNVHYSERFKENSFELIVIDLGGDEFDIVYINAAGFKRLGTFIHAEISDHYRIRENEWRPDVVYRTLTLTLYGRHWTCNGYYKLSDIEKMLENTKDAVRREY